MENVMSKENTFSYKYSATENIEIQEIRKKYLPQSETKLDELKRLDAKVQKSGLVLSLVIGIISSLVFGTGMCLAMQVIGTGLECMILGVVVGVIGMAGMLVAYPVHRAAQKRAKAKFAPRILELTEELSQQHD